MLSETDKVALFVIEQKARVHAQHPRMSEDHIKDEVMMRLARQVFAAREALGKLLAIVSDTVACQDADHRGEWGVECPLCMGELIEVADREDIRRAAEVYAALNLSETVDE